MLWVACASGSETAGKGGTKGALGVRMADGMEGLLRGLCAGWYRGDSTMTWVAFGVVLGPQEYRRTGVHFVGIMAGMILRPRHPGESRPSTVWKHALNDLNGR